MKRKPLAAVAALAALPAVVIAITAMSSSASTPASRTAATTYARLADTSDSGNIQVLGSALDCHTISIAGINPYPGDTAMIWVSANGTSSTVATDNADINQKFSSMTPSTKYTVTMTAGPDSYTFYVTTPAC
jgi:hypothetical protein